MARTRAQAAEAKRKADENKARVAEINDRTADVVHVTEAKGTKRAHRVTCKRALAADPFETTAHTAVNVHQAVAATCCKPHLPAPLGTQPEADAVAEANERRHQQWLADPDVTVEPELAQADPNPVERVRLAKAEHVALQAWIKDGSKPPKPHTPNLDAVNADHAARGGQPRTGRIAATTTNASRARVELGTLPEGATVGTCRACKAEQPVARFPKAVVAGKRMPNLRADECRACREARRSAGKGEAAATA